MENTTVSPTLALEGLTVFVTSRSASVQSTASMATETVTGPQSPETAYSTVTLPELVNVRTASLAVGVKTPGPDNKVKVPPGISGTSLTSPSTQMVPSELASTVTVNTAGIVSAPHICTAAVAKVKFCSLTSALEPLPILPLTRCPT